MSKVNRCVSKFKYIPSWLSMENTCLKSVLKGTQIVRWFVFSNYSTCRVWIIYYYYLLYKSFIIIFQLVVVPMVLNNNKNKKFAIYLVPLHFFHTIFCIVLYIVHFYEMYISIILYIIFKWIIRRENCFLKIKISFKTIWV